MGLLAPGAAASDSDAGPGADADSGRGGDHQLGYKTGFPPRTRPDPRAVPSAAARKTQGARAHPPIPLDRPGGTPSVHSGRFPPLTGGCFLERRGQYFHKPMGRGWRMVTEGRERGGGVLGAVAFPREWVEAAVEGSFLTFRSGSPCPPARERVP